MSLWMLSATPGYCQENQQPRECVWFHINRQTEESVAEYLDLDGKFSTIFQHTVMHLTDGGSSERLLVKRRQFLPPVRPQILLQDFLQVQTHNRLQR